MTSLILGAISLAIPLIALFISFMIAKLSALKAAFVGLIVEMAMIVIFYPSTYIGLSSVWGVAETYSIFGVIWTGMIFGLMYRETGLMDRLIDVLHQTIVSDWGLVAALGGVIQGILGAFNGFAVYPIAIPGIKKLGYESWRSAAGYLVIASWTIPLVSLWIAGALVESATHIPIPEMAPYIGIITIPLIFIAVIGGMRILDEKFNKENLIISSLYIISGLIGIIIFSILIPKLYLLSLISSGILLMVFLVLYSRNKIKTKFSYSMGEALRPFWPIVIGIVLILLWKNPLAKYVALANYSIKLWPAYNSVSINLLTTPAFFIFVVALSTYLFKIKKPSAAPKIKGAARQNPPQLGLWASLLKGSRLSKAPLLTTFLGATFAGVAIMSGQVAAITKLMTYAGTFAYPMFLNLFSWCVGIVFTTGTIGAFMISVPQLAVAATLSLPIGFLLGIIVVMAMGPADPLKPSNIAYAAVLSETPSKDEAKIFNTAFKWMLLELVVALVVTTVISVIIR